MQDQRYPLRNVPAGFDGHSAGLPFFLGVPRVGTPPAQIDDVKRGIAFLGLVALEFARGTARGGASLTRALRRFQV